MHTLALLLPRFCGRGALAAISAAAMMTMMMILLMSCDHAHGYTTSARRTAATAATTALNTSTRTSKCTGMGTTTALSMSVASDVTNASNDNDSKHILYDMPVSNHGARCRIVLYKKNIPNEEVAIVPPSALGGGLKSPEYLALNPQGKMPLLVVPSSTLSTTTEPRRRLAIPESDTICRYLLARYADVGPSFLPDSAKSNLLARWHDQYIAPIQGCMYKAVPPFGTYGDRGAALNELRRQLRLLADVVESYDNVHDGSLKEGGIRYLCGSQVSLADATVFPTMVFVKHMMPKFGITTDEALPPVLDSWFEQVRARDYDFAKVYNEITTVLQTWDANGRWDTIHLAGKRDTDPETVFDKIISGTIPADIVRETDDVLAFRDTNPASPAHYLVIPKRRMGLSSLRRADPDHAAILGKLLLVASDIMNDSSLGFGTFDNSNEGGGGGGGGRIVINDGPDGGQEVPHLHVHVLGGRQLSWPPG